MGSVWDTFDARATLQPSVLTDVLALRPGHSVAGTIRSHLRDPRIAQMLDHFTQYVGSAPDASPAVLCSIAHMQTGEGVWYPQGGTGAIPRALTRLAVDLGVEIRTHTGIRRLLVRHGAVCGVETEAGEQVPLAAVVSNADAVRTHRDLLGGGRQPASSAGGAMSQPVRAWSCTLDSTVPMSTYCITTSVFARSGGGVRGDLSARCASA